MDISKMDLFASRPKLNNSDKELFEAIKEGNFEKVKILIEAEGANIDAIDICGEKPIQVASSLRSLEILKYLHEQGANILERSLAGDLPVHKACREGSIEIIQYAIEHGNDVNDKGSGGSTPLMIACSFGRLSIANYLLSVGANINEINKTGETALHGAARFITMFEDNGIYNFLISKGADTSIKDDRGQTAEELLLSLKEKINEYGTLAEAATTNNLLSSFLEKINRISGKEKDEGRGR
jgi:ankyrin repeat protein